MASIFNLPNNTMSPATPAPSSGYQMLDPYLQGSQNAYSRFQQELLGTPTATQDLPGYGSMVSARGDALEDLATGKAGMGKLFSGSTGQQAADIGGGMEQQLRNQFMSMLSGEAGAGRNMASQATGFGLQEDQMDLQREAMMRNAQSQDDAGQRGFWGDLLGAAGTVGGTLVGLPGVGGAVGNWISGLFS